MRTASVTRNTLETRIAVELAIDGSGCAQLKTGLPFFEHMLDQVARHGLLDLTINAEGDIVSIFDKDNSREVLRKGETGNHLIVFEDAGDAWDFSPDYYVVKPCETTLLSSDSSLDGPVAVMHQTRKYGDSVLSQEIRLASGCRRLDFVTHVDWKERHKMLRVRLPARDTLGTCAVRNSVRQH